MSDDSIIVKLTRLEENQEEMRNDLKNLLKVMNGNGEPHKGFIIRFDRMEQWFLTYTKKKTRIALAAATGMISFCGSLALLVIRLVWGI